MYSTYNSITSYTIYYVSDHDVMVIYSYAKILLHADGNGRIPLKQSVNSCCVCVCACVCV